MWARHWVEQREFPWAAKKAENLAGKWETQWVERRVALMVNHWAEQREHQWVVQRAGCWAA